MDLLRYINSEDRGYFNAFMGTNGLKLCNYTIYEVYNDPKKQLEVAQKLQEVCPSDFVYAMDDGNIFCEVLGVPLMKKDDDFPMVTDHPVKNIEDLKAMKIPNPYEEKRMKTNLETMKLLSDNFDKPLKVSLQGPFTLATQLAGFANVAKSIIKNKEFLNELLKFTREVVLVYAKALIEAGVDYISIAEPSSVILSGERFDTYVVEGLNYIYNNINCIKGLHICGDTTNLLDSMLKCNLNSISLDQIMDLSKVIERIPENIVLLGNIDPINILGKGTVEEVEKETIRIRKSMKDHKNFILAFGCTCLNDTPIENLVKVSEIARLSKEEFNKKQA